MFSFTIKIAISKALLTEMELWLRIQNKLCIYIGYMLTLKRLYFGRMQLVLDCIYS